MANTVEERGRQLAKAALAKSNRVQVDVTGIAGDTITKLNSLSSSLGVTYNSSNNVTGNTTTTRIVTLENQMLVVTTERTHHQYHGVISGMNITKNTTDSSTYDISSGIYYVNGTKVQFSGATGVSTASVTDGEFGVVSIGTSGIPSLYVNTFLTPAQLETEIELGAFSKVSGSINKIGSSYFGSIDFIKKAHLRNKLFEGTKFLNTAGKIYTTGMNVGIEGGYINTPDLEVDSIIADSLLTGQEMYRVGGVYQIQSESTITLRNAEYDDGTGLVTLDNNKYVVHTILRSSRTGTVYVAVGDVQYSKIEDAIDADYSYGVFAGSIGSEIEPLANVVIEKNATDAAAVIDLRNGVKVTTTALSSIFDSRLAALEARVAALEGA